MDLLRMWSRNYRASLWAVRRPPDLLPWLPSKAPARQGRRTQTVLRKWFFKRQHKSKAKTLPKKKGFCDKKAPSFFRRGRGSARAMPYRRRRANLFASTCLKRWSLTRAFFKLALKFLPGFFSYFLSTSVTRWSSATGRFRPFNIR